MLLLLPISTLPDYDTDFHDSFTLILGIYLSQLKKNCHTLSGSVHYIVKYWHLSDSWWTKGRLFVSRNIRNSCSVANDNKKLTNCGSFLSFKSCMYDLIRNNPSTSIAE